MIRTFLLTILSCLPLSGLGVTLGNLTYDIYGYEPWGTARAAVSAYTTQISGDVSIPGGISAGGVQFNVTKVADNGFQGCANMNSISLPPTLLEIGSRAFYACSSLKKVEFPYQYYDPLTFGDGAFTLCTSLTEITLPQMTASIGESSFAQCNALKSITFPSTLKKIGAYAFSGCNSLVNVYTPTVEDWCMKEFAGFESSPFSHNESAALFIANGNKVNYLVPSADTRSIGSYCFAGNSTLTRIELHENFRSLGEGCFQYARNISEITSLSKTPPSAGTYCFDGVSKSIPVHVPDVALEAYRRAEGWKDFTNYVPIITETPERFTEWGIVYSTIGMPEGECAVIGYENLHPSSTVYIGNTAKFGDTRYKVTKIADSAFERAPFPSIELPSDNLREIGNRAFYLTSIENLEIPNGTVSIGDEAFAYCSRLEILRIRSSDLKSIGDKAFLQCNALTGVTIPESLEYLGTEAFSQCRALKNIEIRNGLKTIRNSTFTWAPVESIVLPESIEMIGSNAFSSCENLRNVLITAPQVFISPGVFWYCDNLQQICIVADKILGTDQPQSPFNTTGNVIFLNSQVYDQFISGSIWSNQKLEKREILIDPEKFGLPVGHSESFTFKVNDASMVDQTIQWSSSDESVFSYSVQSDENSSISTGNFIVAHQPGTATLTGIGKYGLKATAQITVHTLPQEMTLTATKTTLNVGDTATIKVAVQPADAYLNPEWTAGDPTVISIEEESSDSREVVIKALKEGFSRITVSSGNLSTALPITVLPQPEKVWISSSNAEIVTGEKLILVAGVSPNDADQAIVWSSMDSNIISCSDDGKGNAWCVGVGPGQCAVRAASAVNPDVFAECIFTVTANVENIILNPSQLSIKVGESYELSAMVIPDNATNQELTWTSTNEEIVIANGNVIHAVSPGEADIVVRATDGSNAEATCHVTVEPVKVESIVLSPYSWNGKPGETFIITARIYPENATDKSLEWTSDDEEVATVDSTGQVTALRPGRATITAMSTDGSGAGAICLVTVEPILIESITLTPDSWEGEEGESFSIQAFILPEIASDQTLEWTSSDDSVATVDSVGTVTVLKAGDCIITASATDGSRISAQCIVMGISAVDELFDMADVFDIYTLSGTLIKRNADKHDLKLLSPAVYILRTSRSSTTVIIH